MPVRPDDLFDVRALLTDEERAVQEAVARFTDTRVVPAIGDAFDAGRFPREWIPELAQLGLLGASLPVRDGDAGLGAVSYGLICQELERGDSGLRSFVSVQSSLCMYPIHAYGSDEQRQRWLPEMAAGRVDRLLRPERGAGRVGSRRDDDARGARGRRLALEWRQDVDHQR